MGSNSESESGCSQMKMNANIQSYLLEPLQTVAAEVASSYDVDTDINIKRSGTKDWCDVI